MMMVDVEKVNYIYGRVYKVRVIFYTRVRVGGNNLVIIDGKF